MQECSFSPESDPFKIAPKMRTTYGELLPDGSIIELVTIDDSLLLLHSDGIHHLVVPSFDFGNVIFTAPQLGASLSAALTFPGPPAESSGSMSNLFEDASAIFQQRGFSDEVSHWGGLFSLVSWIPEFFPNAPTLVAYGGDIQQAALFFKLLTRTCRRAFFCAQLCRSLPFGLKPTLLVLAGDISAKAYSFWRASSMTGVYVPARGGSVESLACARALFIQDDKALASFGDEAWRLALLPDAQLSRVTDHELTEISQALLPKMLAFRLRRLSQVQRPDAAAGQKQFATGIRQLLMLVEDDLAKKIAPLVAKQEAEVAQSRKSDPYRAIVEALWGPSHADKRLSVSELANRVNALLCAGGELISLDEREIGWKCRQLGLHRQRNSGGMFLALF